MPKTIVESCSIISSTFIVLLVASCTTDPAGPPTETENPPEAVVATIDVTVATDTLIIVGETGALQIILRGQDGAVLTGRAVSWSTSDASVAGVSGNDSGGTVTAVAAGTVVITAEAEGQSGSVVMRMIQADVAAFEAAFTDAYTEILLANANGTTAPALREAVAGILAALDTRMLSVVREGLDETAALLTMGASEDDTITFAVLELILDHAKQNIAF